jgi:hypothetical protein
MPALGHGTSVGSKKKKQQIQKRETLRPGGLVEGAGRFLWDSAKKKRTKTNKREVVKNMIFIWLRQEASRQLLAKPFAKSYFGRGITDRERGSFEQQSAVGQQTTWRPAVLWRLGRQKWARVPPHPEISAFYRTCYSAWKILVVGLNHTATESLGVHHTPRVGQMRGPGPGCGLGAQLQAG